MRQYSSNRSVINAVAASAQVLLVSTALFLSYSTAIRTSGTAALGIYSLMLSFSALAQAASLGAAIGAPRHIADLVGSRRQSHLLGSLNLSILMAIAGPAVSAALLVSGFNLYSGSMPAGTGRETVRALAPWVGGIAVLVPVSATLQGIVDGLNRASQRALAAIAAAGAYLAVAQIAIPRIGIVGLAIATVVQHTVTIGICGTIAYRATATSGSRRWLPRDSLVEHFQFNLRMQLLTLPTIAFDPTAKLFVAQGAGVSYVAVYEVASRLMQQTNNLLLSANQTLVPLLTFRAARKALDRTNSFLVPFSSLAWLGLTSFGLVLACVPVFGDFLLPRFPVSFAYASTALAIAWFANTMSGPGYFLAVALGQLRTSLFANYFSLLIIVAGGTAAALSTAGFLMPVVLAVAFSLNSLIITRQALRRSGLTGKNLVNRATSTQAVATALGYVAALALWRNGVGAAWATSAGAATILAGAAATFRHTRLALVLPALRSSLEPTSRHLPE